MTGVISTGQQLAEVNGMESTSLRVGSEPDEYSHLTNSPGTSNAGTTETEF